jgi:hypothetical protein
MKHNPTEGEEMIKDFLLESNIKYEEQKKIPTLKNDSKKFRIADFYLPRFDIYLEFLGDWEKEEGEDRYKEKMRVYRENNISCIYIWPNNLGSLNWIFKERLRAKLLECKKYRMLFLFEIEKIWRTEWISFMIALIILGTITQNLFKNIWITLGTIITLIIIICICCCKGIRRRYKRIKARNNLN